MKGYLDAAIACSAALPTIEILGDASQTDAAPATAPPTLISAAPAVLVSSDLISQQEALISLYESVSPGVVSIFVANQQGSGQGSGFVIDQDGHIVTNYHVVEGASYMEVSFSSGAKALAEVVGIDTDSDLAVIRVEAASEELRPLARLGEDVEKGAAERAKRVHPSGFLGWRPDASAIPLAVE